MEYSQTSAYMNNPEEYEKIDAAASLIAKEKFNIKKQINKHFVLNNNQIYMIGFGNGDKTDSNPKGLYCYWVWYFKNEPYGGMVNCELKDKFDAIDYFQSCVQNAEATIAEVLKNANPDGEQA